MAGQCVSKGIEGYGCRSLLTLLTLTKGRSKSGVGASVAVWRRRPAWQLRPPNSILQSLDARQRDIQLRLNFRDALELYLEVGAELFNGSDECLQVVRRDARLTALATLTAFATLATSSPWSRYATAACTHFWFGRTS